ncbi:MAG: hypothetical protein PHV37_02040 [Candidatus Gastranaerophilales bacterium]|nr:hypothetical protein [Candidatus Gastranaerophilales bacterium]
MFTDELIILESSLRNYMLDSLNEGGRPGVSAMKYRGLTLNIDDRDKETPVFKVRIAALEAAFRIRDGIKITGSLAGDEKLVEKWYFRGYNKQQMEEIVSGSDKNLGEKVREAISRDFVQNFINNMK